MELKSVDGRFYVTSDTYSGTLYKVCLKSLIGRATCSCPDWQYRKYDQGLDCKHIKFVKNLMLLGGM